MKLQKNKNLPDMPSSTRRKTEKVNTIGILKEAVIIALLVTMLLTVLMFIL
jgi:hypothetical protein